MDRIDEGGDEQVTIVRIAIEDILEKAIDPRALEPSCVSVCARKSRVRAGTRAVAAKGALSCDRGHGERVFALLGTPHNVRNNTPD